MDFQKTIAALKPIIEGSDTRAGAVFQWIVQVLIILSLVMFSVSTIPTLSKETRYLLWYMELIIVVIFSAEYILRIIVADKKSNYIFSGYGVIDLIAIVPFYVLLIFSTGVDLRAARVVRLFMILRILKIARYDTAIQRYIKAFLIIKEELLVFSLIAFMFIFISSVGIYYSEYVFPHEKSEDFNSIFHSLWWAVVTLTTVGYGDVSPVTIAGKIFTSLVILVGIGIVAVPTGLLASALSTIRREEALEALEAVKKEQSPQQQTP